jgi:hypothetical protein
VFVYLAGKPADHPVFALPGRSEQVLDPAQTVCELGDIGLGRALRAGLQGEREPASRPQAPAADLRDVAGVP